MPSLVNQYKDVVFEYDAAASWTLKVYTNLPGTVMTLRRTITMPSSTGRRTFTANFEDLSNAVIEGTLIMFRAEATGVVRIFRAVLRHRRLGVYFDGSLNEIWETLELAF